MPQQRFKYDPTFGPIIDGAISYPIQLLRPGAVAPKAPAKFLVDTGSMRSFVHPSLVSALALHWVDRKAVWSMAGPVDVDIYAGDVELFGLGMFAGVELRELPKPHPNAAYTAIVGMDILGGGSVRVDGRTKEITIAF
jgi:hypothetical protein